MLLCNLKYYTKISFNFQSILCIIFKRRDFILWISSEVSVSVVIQISVVMNMYPGFDGHDSEMLNKNHVIKFYFAEGKRGIT